jgi:cobalamin 5'-phosphate synthase/cobalamin synthase
MRVAKYALAPVVALSFLTRMPFGRLVAVDGDDVARAAPLYPLVGAGIGALAGAVCDAASGPLPATAAGALALAVAALLTGGMHLDALADTADALGATTRERRLAVMRDHAVGAFGVVALVLAVLVEAVLLGALAVEGSAWSAFAVAAACGRWAPLPLAAALPYVRESGQGAALAQIGWAPVVAALALVVAIAFAATGLEALAPLATSVGVATVLGGFFRSAFGGVTGDTHGATTELAQAAALAALVVV